MTPERYDNTQPRQYPNIQGCCPSCRAESLFLGTNGYVTCSVIGCKDPGAAHDMLKHGVNDSELAGRLQAEARVAVLEGATAAALQAGQRLAELEAYVRECVTNWDHDEDAHTHHTSCRVCQGEALLPQPKEAKR